MPREALAAVLLQLTHLKDRLHLAAEEALELVADDASLVHLEQRRVGRAPQALTPPMAPDQLLMLLDGMGLALDLERHLAPRPPTLVQLPGPVPGRPVRQPQEPRGKALDRVFYLIDLAELDRIDPEVRKDATSTLAEILLRGMVVYSASIKARVILRLIFTALNLFSNKADRVPLYFTHTEAEARAWIEKRRRELDPWCLETSDHGPSPSSARGEMPGAEGRGAITGREAPEAGCAAGVEEDALSPPAHAAARGVAMDRVRVTAMERVRVTDYGVDIVFGDPLTREEAAELLAELQRRLPPPGGHFGLLVDSRRSRSYAAAEQEIFKRGILLCVERGMERSVVVHDSHIAALQAKRLGKETGTMAWTRYIDARSHLDWQRIAEHWLRHGIDPELSEMPGAEGRDAIAGLEAPEAESAAGGVEEDALSPPAHAEARGAAMERVRVTDYGVDIAFGAPPKREEAAEPEHLPILEHLPIIREAAAHAGRRYGLCREDVEDFTQHVLCKVFADDFAVIRKHQGRSVLATYLVVMVQQALLDYVDALLGKRRPSAEAHRLGPMAERPASKEMELPGEIGGDAIDETTAAASACPDLEDIAALLDGKLPADQQAQLIEHRAACESCNEVFAGAARFMEDSQPADSWQPHPLGPF